MNNIKKYLETNLLDKTLATAQEKNKNLNAFTYFLDVKTSSKTKGKLLNVPFAIKDNFELKNEVTSSSSNTLKTHISVITATVVKRLMDQGAIPIGKTNLDEFGMGGTGLTSANGPVKNPLDNSRIIGGSSSGSAASVAANIVPFALGTDTGDSIRQPAAWTGVVGFKPTWGLISRYGIHLFSPAFDTTGFFTTNVQDQALLVSIVSGSDENDFTCLQKEPVNLVDNLNSDIKGKKIAYFKEQTKVSSQEYIEKFKVLLEKLKNKGAIIEEVSFSPTLLEALYPTYQAITFSEASSQVASIDGINFANIIKGNESLYKNIAKGRRENFGQLLKERIIIGANSLNEENQTDIFLKAKKIRTLIIQETNKIFDKYDAIINLASEIAPKVETVSISTKTEKLVHNFFLISNMGGYPSIVLPFEEKDNLPISVEIFSKIFNDQEVLNIALAVENITKVGK